MSTLRRYAHLSQEPDEAQARRAAAKAYHEQGIVLINPAWLHAWADRKQIELLAEKLFGARGGQ